MWDKFRTVIFLAIVVGTGAAAIVRARRAALLHLLAVPAASSHPEAGGESSEVSVADLDPRPHGEEREALAEVFPPGGDGVSYLFAVLVIVGLGFVGLGVVLLMLLLWN